MSKSKIPTHKLNEEKTEKRMVRPPRPWPKPTPKPAPKPVPKPTPKPRPKD